MMSVVPRRNGAAASRRLESSGTWATLVAASPGVMLAALFALTDYPLELRVSVMAVVVLTTLGAVATVRMSITRALGTVANALEALGEGEYSIRLAGASNRGVLGGVIREVNALGTTLQRQRTELAESTALLRHVMEEITIGVFAFDASGRVVFVNRAGACMIDLHPSSVSGVTADSIGFAQFLTGQPTRVIETAFGGRPSRCEFRRVTFYRAGRPHSLVVATDLGETLRHEEQIAWQRIVRVLSHEINNSLTPIRSIAHSLGRLIDQDRDGLLLTELRPGIALIEERAASLGRFIHAYAQLAKLPEPTRNRIEVEALVSRVVALEGRLTVTVTPSPRLTITGDADQLEQLLINIVRNAVDASLETGGSVAVGWHARRGWIEILVTDQGRGLPDRTHLFVPFFTTKPGGSGIGLALSRQIADAHNGTLSLEERQDVSGCVARLRLPMS